MADGVSASIVIPTFNRPDLLRAAVASALKALPPGGEVIVTDDRSDPPASAALRSIDHPALRITVNTRKQGASGNRNHGVAEARGRVVFFLDDDDVMVPGYPEAVLSWKNYGYAWGFSEINRHVGDVVLGPFDAAVLPTPLDNVPFRRKPGGLGCGFWIERDLFVSIGGIDEALSVNEDTEFSIRLLSNGHIPLFSTVPGVSVRQHRGVRLTQSSLPSERARCFRHIMDRHASFLAAEPDAFDYVQKRLLKMLAQDRQFRAGFRAALRDGPVAQRPASLFYFLGRFAIATMAGR